MALLRWGGSSNQYFSLGRLPILIPDKPEQQKIVSFLDYETSKIDTLVQKKQRFIELLEENRSALISHAVTKGLDLDVEMKNSGVEWIGDIPDHWKAIPFRRGFELPTGFDSKVVAFRQLKRIRIGS